MNDIRQLLALLPLMIPAAAAVLILLVLAVGRRHGVSAAIAWIGLAGGLAAAIVLPHLRGVMPRAVTDLLLIDRFAMGFAALIYLSALAAAVLSRGYLRLGQPWPDEYYVLLLLASVGAAALAAAAHLASLVLGMELLTVSLYGLIAYDRSRRGVEAGIKYLVLAGASSALLIFGAALLYAETGRMSLVALAQHALTAPAPPPVFLAGAALLLVGLGFKLALAPMHLWAADVYQGAPAPVTAVVASVSKAAALAALLRLTVHLSPPPAAWAAGLSALAVLSMVLGNLLALRQLNLKRIIAYSSIAHLGYVLVAVRVGGPGGLEAAGFYIATYILAVLGALGVVTVLSNRRGEPQHLDDYRGLAWRRPALAGLLTLCMISLAGLPISVGFVGKVYLVVAGVRGGQWPLVVTLMATSAAGLYYYARVILALFVRPEDAGAAPASAELPPRVGLAAGAVLALLGLAILGLGLWPGPLADAVRYFVHLP